MVFLYTYAGNRVHQNYPEMTCMASAETYPRSTMYRLLARREVNWNLLRVVHKYIAVSYAEMWNLKKSIIRIRNPPRKKTI